ncbi:glycosyltransferase [Paraglaciecola sp. MB-3u-78]|uniref:glycosyltransferase n=1 Tax=Paraglaciecola sp. MB-3u-78 TaxID=2058332 RepID=UPI0026982F11
MSNPFKIISSANPEASSESVVGMAVYIEDRLDWVEQAINSILQQTYQKYVFVIVIDGEINQKIYTYLCDVCRQNKQMILVLNRSNLGLSTCMNFVVDWVLAKNDETKYFFRMDADDISEENRFAAQVDYLEKHQNVSVLGCALKEINEFGAVVGKRKLPLKHGDIVKFLPKRCSINHPTVAIRFDVFKNGFRYNEALRNTQDYFLWIELAAAGYQFANLGKKLLQFRRVNDFYKRRGLNKSLNEFKARFYAMRVLKRYTVGNIVYAFAVLFLRLMPSKVVKLAYKLDRYLLAKKVKHE